MRTDTHKLALCAVLTALTLTLSYMEGLLPTALVLPLPGFKLGLANIVTVFALYYLGAGPAFLILAARCLLGAMFAGNASALIFSLNKMLAEYRQSSIEAENRTLGRKLLAGQAQPPVLISGLRRDFPQAAPLAPRHRPKPRDQRLLLRLYPGRRALPKG